MIRDYNIANDANIQLHKILGATIGGQMLTGELMWCGDSGDAAFNKMRSRVPAGNLFTDLDVAVSACVANRGDVIVCMEGFSQAVIAAGGLDLDVSGITIVFLGSGTTQAKITFSTAATADMDVDAANITLIRPKFVAAIDSLQGPIDVNATDFTIIDGEYHDATDVETLDAIIATAGATRLKINGYKYFSTTETGDLKQSHIQINGCDDIVLENIDIRGNFFVGCIENVTDEVLNARFKNLYCENLNATPKPALFLDANATGSMQNVKLKIASGTTYYNSAGKFSWDGDCQGFVGDGVTGDQLGTGGSGAIDTVVDTIASDLVVADALIDTIKSDLIVADALIDTIKSDLIVVDATADKISSDLIVLDAIVDGEVTKTTTIASDLVVMDAILDTVKSDLIVQDALIDTIKSDLILLTTMVSDFIVKYTSDVI